MSWGSAIEVERRNRIRLAVFAYAYEVENAPLIDDAGYDALSQSIDPSIDTGNQEMDDFFMVDFIPDTGMWIHQHPQIAGIKKIYERTFKKGDKKSC